MAAHNFLGDDLKQIDLQFRDGKLFPQVITNTNVVYKPNNETAEVQNFNGDLVQFVTYDLAHFRTDYQIID